MALKVVVYLSERRDSPKFAVFADIKQFSLGYGAQIICGHGAELAHIKFCVCGIFLPRVAWLIRGSPHIPSSNAVCTSPFSPSHILAAS